MKLEELKQYLTIEKIPFTVEGGKVLVSPEANLAARQKTFWSRWQLALKYAAAYNQGGKDPFGIILGDIENTLETQLHHALITKRTVMGMRGEVKNRIHHSFNVIVVATAGHEGLNRQRSFCFLADLYSERSIRAWYNYVDAFFKTRLPLLPTYREMNHG